MNPLNKQGNLKYYRPGSIAEVALNLRNNGKLGFVVKEFLLEWQKAPKLSMLVLKPINVTATTDVFLAGLTECLCEKIGVTPPPWTCEPDRFLVEPVYWTTAENLRETLKRETPEAFAKRQLYCGKILLTTN